MRIKKGPLLLVSSFGCIFALILIFTFSEDLLLILEPYPTKLIILDSEHPPRFNFSYPIDVGDEVCSKPEILLLAVVITAPQNFLKRRLIRETWGGVMHKSKSMNVVFLVGHSSNQTINNLVIEESNWNQDIIQGDFEDSYLNLSLKGIFFLEWVHQSNVCSKVKWILKIDDDVILNPYKLHGYLQTYRRKDHKIHCKIHYKSLVQRDPTQKWCLTRKEFPDKYYPDYCSGPMYLLSAKTVPRLILEQRRDPAPMLVYEDIYYTGMLAKRAKIRLKTYSGDFRSTYTTDVNTKTFFVVADNLNETFITHGIHAVWEPLTNLTPLPDI